MIVDSSDGRKRVLAIVDLVNQAWEEKFYRWCALCDRSRGNRGWSSWPGL